MRVREWYGWHFPEMGKIVTENVPYAKCAKKMGMRTNCVQCDFADILDEETEQAREIRRMRFARVFRQHANKEADRTKSRERLLLEKVTSIMTTPAREEAEDSPAQPAQKTFDKWSKAVKNVQAVAAAEKEEAAKAEANASPRDTTRSSEDADGGGPDGTLSITRSRSKPHDFNSTQLAQWRVLTHHKTSSVGEDSVRADAAELIGPPSASRMTQ